jgi:hypothetical protein
VWPCSFPLPEKDFDPSSGTRTMGQLVTFHQPRGNFLSALEFRFYMFPALAVGNIKILVFCIKKYKTELFIRLLGQFSAAHTLS